MRHTPSSTAGKQALSNHDLVAFASSSSASHDLQPHPNPLHTPLRVNSRVLLPVSIARNASKYFAFEKAGLEVVSCNIDSSNDLILDSLVVCPVEMVRKASTHIAPRAGLSHNVDSSSKAVSNDMARESCHAYGNMDPSSDVAHPLHPNLNHAGAVSTLFSKHDVRVCCSA